MPAEHRTYHSVSQGNPCAASKLTDISPLIDPILDTAQPSVTLLTNDIQKYD